MQTETQTPRASSQQVTLRVQGMSCGGCAAGVERRMRAMDGVGDVHVDLAQAEARVEVDLTRTSPEVLAALLTGAGYESAVLEK